MPACEFVVSGVLVQYDTPGAFHSAILLWGQA